MYIPSPLISKNKEKRKSAKQQVREERERILNQIRVRMIDKKRSIPKEWERGFMAAVSVIEELNI